MHFFTKEMEDENRRLDNYRDGVGVDCRVVGDEWRLEMRYDLSLVWIEKDEVKKARLFGLEVEEVVKQLEQAMTQAFLLEAYVFICKREVKDD